MHVTWNYMNVLWTVPLALVLLGSWVQKHGSCFRLPHQLSGGEMSERSAS